MKVAFLGQEMLQIPDTGLPMVGFSYSLIDPINTPFMKYRWMKG